VLKFPIIYISKICLIAILLTLCVPQKKLYADETGGGIERIRSCNAITGKINDFDAFIPPGKISKEMNFVLTNPVCITVAATSYAIIKGAVGAINCNCNSNCLPRLLPSLLKDVADIAKAGKKAFLNPRSTCGGVFATSSAAILTAFTAGLGTIYEVAKDEYNRVGVCGHDWFAPDPEKYTNSKEGPFQTSVKTPPVFTISGAEASSTEDAKKYRQWFYGGKEFEDNPNSGDKCSDPTRSDNPQRYYFRGLQPANFLCERYNPIYNSEAKFKKAYECCLNRSQNYICLEKKSYHLGDANHSIWNGDHIFCRGDSKCSFKKNVAITYETYRRDNRRLICAQSYSLCPYNFSVGGGTVNPDYYKDGIVDGDGKFVPLDPKKVEKKVCSDTETEIRGEDCSLNKKAGKLKNFCQYFTHCTLVPNRPYVNTGMDFMSPYYSKACIDFVGDSQNGVRKTRDEQSGVEYNGGILFGQQVNFTAPIVQCFKETMANIFTNSFGHSKCRDGTFGNSRNECRVEAMVNGSKSYSDNYLQINRGGTNINYQIGNKVKEYSFFEKLQSRLRAIITTFLVLSMSFFGFKLLAGKVDIENRKEFLMYIIKIAFVVYFVNGNAWRTIFFDGIYNGSNEISRIFFKIKSDIKNDKCNFGAQFTLTGSSNGMMRSYPPGKEYLMVWDTLDCKIMQYMNYGPSFNSSTIFLLIIAAFFTGGIGLSLAMSVFIIAFCLISTAIRAMHIFISSAIAIIIYVFISPIIIPLVLFERTKSIFDTWLTQLISFTLSPIVLFAYLAIFISISEQVMFGGAIINGDGRIECGEYCITANLTREASSSPNCNGKNKRNPLDENAACILNFNEFSKKDGFALFGIGLPAVGKLTEKGKVELRFMIILKTALFLYVLYEFMNEIPGVIGRLTGEVIDVKTAGGFEMLKKFTNAVRAAQKRGARLTKSVSKSNLKSMQKGDSKDGGEGGGGEDTPPPDTASQKES